MSTSGINNESTLMKVPKHFVNKKVATSRGKTETVQAVAPLHQAQTHHHSESFYTQCFKGVPQNLFRNHGAKFSGMVQAGAFTKMKSVTLKITIRNSGATTTMASLPYWFERLEMRSANGSKHLGTMYADNIAFNLGALLSEQQLKSVLPSANMDEDFRPSRPLLPNETKSFYLPLAWWVGFWIPPTCTGETSKEISSWTFSLLPASFRKEQEILTVSIFAS